MLFFIKLSSAAWLLLILSLLSANVLKGDCAAATTAETSRPWGWAVAGNRTTTTTEEYVIGHDDEEVIEDSGFESLIMTFMYPGNPLKRPTAFNGQCNSRGYGNCINPACGPKFPGRCSNNKPRQVDKN
ncbi:OLC1v1009785C2 [Oldenlandia corymbosa var. corymbosa]|nr:OLC1v1009785C2 [Oldenlandia corymbosa var. corymbosa]